MTMSRKTIIIAMGRAIGGMHVWNMPSGRRRFPIENPTTRALLAFWTLTGFTWIFVIGVLSMGLPEWGISPDPRLNGMIYSPVFWLSSAAWFLYGSGCFYMMARWGPDRLMSIFLIAAFVAVVAIYLEPFVCAAFFPGFSLGVAVEGLLYRMHMSSAE